MTLHEPATFVTDLAFGFLAIGLAWRLHRRASANNPAARWWTCVLGLTAASAFIGGSYHGFSPNVSSEMGAIWWRGTLLTINLLSAAMGMSWAHEIVSKRWRGWVFLAVALKLLVFAVLVLRSPKFLVAIADYGSTMLAWLIATIVLHRKWRSWMLAGLVGSALSAMVQQFRWAPAPWFNHNDLYHVIQMLALIAFYRAGRQFGAAA